MEDETTVSDRKQLIHVSNPQRCPGDESDSDWWIHWSFKNWSIRSLMWCDVFTSALQEPPGEEADSGERQHHLQRRGGQRRRSLTPVSRLRPLTHPSPPGSDPLRGRAEPQEAEGVGRRLGGRGGQWQPHPSSQTPQRGAGLWDRAGVQTTPTAGPRPGLQPDQVRPESRVQLLHWFTQRCSHQFLPVISHQNVSSLQVCEDDSQRHRGPSVQVPRSAHRSGGRTDQWRGWGQRKRGGRRRSWGKNRKWRRIRIEQHQWETVHHLHPDERRTVLCECENLHASIVITCLNLVVVISFIINKPPPHVTVNRADTERKDKPAVLKKKRFIWVSNTEHADS